MRWRILVLLLRKIMVMLTPYDPIATCLSVVDMVVNAAHCEPYSLANTYDLDIKLSHGQIV